MPRIAAPASIDRFVEDHLGRWSRLADLVARASGRVSRLDAAEVLELGVLYRAATSDLAIAQRDFAADVVTTELNDLVAAAHALVYSEAPTSGKRLRRFVVEEVPATVRANMRFVIASAVLLFGPALVTFVAGLLSPALAMGALPAPIRDQLVARRPGTEIPETLRLNESPVIIVNNVRIAVVAAAGGLTAGLLTGYVLVADGAVLGTIFAVLELRRVSWALLPFLAAHGLPQPSAIVLSRAPGPPLPRADPQPGEPPRGLPLP